MTRVPTERAKALVRQFEGYREKAYLCPAGVFTIAFGHTRGVKEGDRCDMAQAELWLSLDLATAAASIERKIGEANVLALTDNQFDALCSFVFNLGTGPKSPEWQLWGLLRKRQFDQIPAQLARFVYAGKTKLNGLVRRRNAEIALWSDAEPGAADEPTSSAETRVVETPPAASPKTLQPAHLITAAIAGAGGIAEGVKAVSQAIQPYAQQSDAVQHALGYLATCGAVAAVVVLAFTFLQHRKEAG